MRKYPPVPILTRISTQETTLPESDVQISKGLQVIIPVIALHRDPNIYPDPEKFCPERFTPENKSTRHPYTYLPFGGGPRTCIGTKTYLSSFSFASLDREREFPFDFISFYYL